MLPASDLSGAAHTSQHTADIAGAERELNRLHRYGLSDAGKAWLIAATDPFHDRALECHGYPDYSAQHTITQVVKVSRTILPPTTLADGETWTAHVASTPYMEEWNALSAGYANPGEVVMNTSPATVFEGATGTLMTAICSSGAPAVENRTWPELNTLPQNVGPFAVSYSGLAPVAMVRSGTTWTPTRPYTIGRHRAIAAGFEVVNATPPLFKGGLVTVYRQNSNHKRHTGALYTSNASTGPTRYSDMLVSAVPPGTLADALNLPGARQWAASEGVYIPLVLQGEDNDFQQVSKLEIVPRSDLAPGTEPVAGFIRCNTENGYGLPPFSVTDKSFNNFHQCGAYFTGLAKQTSLNVSLRMIIERAPATREYDLVPLAAPSPAHDPVAFLFYSEAMRLMPPGVRLDENFTGGWFREAVGNVIAVLKPQVQRAITVAAPVARQMAERQIDRAVDRAADRALGGTPRSRRRQPDPPPLPPTGTKGGRSQRRGGRK